MKFDALTLLNWIIYGGGSIALFSFVAVYWKWFQSQDKNVKFWVSSVIASVLAVAAYALVAYAPPEFFALIDPYVKIVGMVFVANGFKQVWYDNVTGKIDTNKG